MLPLGHTSFSYLISQLPRIKGKRLPLKEVLFILFCGNIFDLDLIFYPLLFGKSSAGHHFFVTHTPLAGMILFVIFFYFCESFFSKETIYLAGLAMLGHFVLDDLFYWFGLMGIVEQNHPQIFWLYPFDPRYEPTLQWAQEHYLNQGLNRLDILIGYISGAFPVFLLEIFLALTAILLCLQVFSGRSKDDVGR